MGGNTVNNKKIKLWECISPITVNKERLKILYNNDIYISWVLNFMHKFWC